jgi:hypothetical protein
MCFLKAVHVKLHVGLFGEAFFGLFINPFVTKCGSKTTASEGPCSKVSDRCGHLDLASVNVYAVLPHRFINEAQLPSTAVLIL